jgi:DNA end-binding protein Ku
MPDRQQVGIGTVVMRTKQYLAAIRPLEGVLALSTMHFADEVVARSDIENLPAKSKPASQELRLAT